LLNLNEYEPLAEYSSIATRVDPAVLARVALRRSLVLPTTPRKSLLLMIVWLRHWIAQRIGSIVCIIGHAFFHVKNAFLRMEESMPENTEDPLIQMTRLSNQTVATLRARYPLALESAPSLIAAVVVVGGNVCVGTSDAACESSIGSTEAPPTLVHTHRTNDSGAHLSAETTLVPKTEEAPRTALTLPSQSTYLQLCVIRTIRLRNCHADDWRTTDT
jgi:hypothetical protein